MLPQGQLFVSTLPDGRRLRTTVYTFEKAGDEIPMHDHPYWHNCQVVIGGIRIYDDEGKSVTLGPGELAGLKAKRKHAIQATEDGTIAININEPDLWPL